MTPTDRSSRSSRSLHDLAEDRSLDFHRAVASRLALEPELLERARERVERWVEEGGRSVRYARRWREILSGPVSEISALLVDEGEEARALRQSTPFAGALDPRERWRLWREARARSGPR